ncbi:K+-dependent Na+/Ca+ exchanger family protein [Bacteriovorax sp. BAL6_X]|uniref:calcium/sodium antiporter n=1 Tax=Bacteriovorax sp. BAL6_X TaxID=1201290 RepID=UPI000385F540|nr:calcium/sodium antiporter [Bacteriovorax sp. BAL6_X]EPZ52002.1 K+-dependent Na+/Ca+ exchanger family protein [Bacteriovorax sp. BAL6_X]
MLLFGIAIIVGLALMVLSADKFVDGASTIAGHYGMSPLLIGMVVVGFGTSAPEMVVSVLSSIQGNSGIALGNAYGSNITNIGLILGVVSIYVPITFHTQVLKKELPILFFATIVSAWILFDLNLSRSDAVILLLLFIIIVGWTIRQGVNSKDALTKEIQVGINETKTSVLASCIIVIGSLAVLILSSRLLVYGAVGISTALGVPDILIGLSVVAVGTSLPELASSIIAARKGEPDIALGNILGSNLFNTLAVMGASGLIDPITIEENVFYRDIGFMTFLTMLLFLFGYGFKSNGKISRVEGSLLLVAYIAYTSYLVFKH